MIAAAVIAAIAIAALALVLRGRPSRVVSTTGTDFGRPQANVRAQDLNVLLITLDTTRADYLGAYGDQHGITPHLDRLAAEGTVFEDVTTVAPLTLPAHSSIFTGLLPPRHGVRDNGGYVLDPKHRTLASDLHDGGWQTAAFVAAFVLDGRWGLNQGFDTYYDKFDLSKYKRISLSEVSRRGGEVVDQALPWLRSHASGKFFAWLHFYDAHSPYDPPEPYKTSFAGHPYAGEIAYVDAQVGRVLDWLRSAQLDDRTVVVVVGDHGESLNEHGEGSHALFIYRATTRVPLIVRAPFASLRGRRVASAVRTIDIMPTVLDMLHQPIPADLQGRSLAPLLTGASTDLQLDAYSESLYGRHHFGWSELRALKAGRFKYIQSTHPELYDLQQDPNELKNIIDQRSALARTLATELEKVSENEDTGATSPGATIDPETRERLAALGYIGTLAQAPAAPGQALPDPKDKIGVFNLMMSAHEAGDAPGGAIERLKKVVASDPEIVDAWVMLGNEYRTRGDIPNALSSFKRATELNPTYDVAIINLANTYRAAGDIDAARVGYERYLERDPKNALVRYQLGEVFVDLGDLDAAEKEFRQALSDDTRVASARNALGVVALRRGDVASAEREVRAAIQERPDVKLAHFNLALIAEQKREYGVAVQEYQRELDVYPNNFKAAFNLGKLYEAMGDRQGQEREFRKALDINPGFAEGYFFLSKLYLDEGRSPDEAVRLAKKGLEVGPNSPYAPLGHYLLADLYNRAGRHAEAEAEASRGREIERRLGARAGHVS